MILFFKVRTILDIVTFNFDMEYNLGESISVDEAILDIVTFNFDMEYNLGESISREGCLSSNI